ncbi:hypothetical protein NXV03_22565 [Phocaeicola vulgatus]|nr:hypothetical protein [Phocaeicola vulgatus]
MAAFFYMVKRVAVTTFTSFYPKKSVGGGRNRRRRMTKRWEKVGIQAHSTRKPDRQNIVHQQTRY